MSFDQIFLYPTCCNFKKQSLSLSLSKFKFKYSSYVTLKAAPVNLFLLRISGRKLILTNCACDIDYNAPHYLQHQYIPTSLYLE